MRPFLYVLLYSCNSFAQNEYAHWVVQTFEVNFCDSISLNTTNLNLGDFDGAATICNKATGNLLFYTDGVQAFNKNLQQMPNGNNLAGDQESTQGALIVPQPGSNHIYYIFTSNRYSWPGGLEYSIVDMNKDVGLGDITVKNVFLDSTTEKLNAVYNASGNFFWVIALNPITNNFMSFRLDSNGLNTTPVLSPSHVFITNTFQRSGYLKSSPNGKNIVSVFESHPYAIGLYNFNKDSGKLDLQTFLPLESQDDQAWGTSFSPNNSKLYVTGYSNINNTSDIYQFDVTSNDTDVIKASGIIISTISFNFGFDGMQIGPDQKIYIIRDSYDSLCVIDKPNLTGVACQFELNKIYIPAINLNDGLSNNIDGLYYFADSNNINLSYSVSCNKLISFTINTARAYSYFQVNFGDGSDTLLDSTQYTFNHRYSLGGTYTVKLNTASGCNIQDSVTISVTVDTAKCPLPPPPLSIPTLIYCGGNQTLWQIISLPYNTAVTIYDELGRTIYKTSNYLNNYDMRNLPPAMYFYRLDLQDGVEYKGKVLVVK